MCERVDNYWRQQFKETGQDPIGEIVAMNFLEGPDKCVFSFDVQPPSPTNDSGPSAYDDTIFEAQLLQTQIDSLQEAQVLTLEKGKKKVQFDAVEIMEQAGPPRPGAPSTPHTSGPTMHACGPVPPRE